MLRRGVAIFTAGVAVPAWIVSSSSQAKVSRVRAAPAWRAASVAAPTMASWAE